VALGRSLALECGPKGVSVNVVSPGIWTRRWRRPHCPDRKYARASRQPFPAGGIASPESIAELISFLLSGKARQLAGQEIVVDGAKGLTSYGGVAMVNKLWERDD
jgi:NAD(P)-dependent dehydrogenase (short-subunit alcohol dehydrogenase family)